MTGRLITCMSCSHFSEARLPFFVSKGFFPEITFELYFAILSSDVFLCTAGFFWEDLQCNRRETRLTFLGKAERRDICNCG